MNDPMPVQDLRRFRVPPGFRGRGAATVQLWWLVQATLFGLSPQIAYGWRRWLLRRFGARIGQGVLIRPSARVTYPWKLTIGDYAWVGDQVVLYSLGEIAIGSNAVISQRCYLCAGSHDFTRPDFPICAEPVSIGAEAWLATDVFVAPGVAIGRGTVVGARSGVFSDLPEMMLCRGTPARPLRPRLPGDRSPDVADPAPRAELMRLE
ncbi:MAG TPA: putative colanic acid biosynthesis acetyltransferase [Stellaceae bacterium]|nr:putative colanic acid biosynthesis acetyltransferase [Stellaceae bacterium]